jgi:hypothetical protein
MKQLKLNYSSLLKQSSEINLINQGRAVIIKALSNSSVGRVKGSYQANLHQARSGTIVIDLNFYYIVFINRKTTT